MKHAALLIPYQQIEPMKTLEVDQSDIGSLQAAINVDCLDFISHPQQRTILGLDDAGLLKPDVPGRANVRAWLLDAMLKSGSSEDPGYSMRLTPIVGHVIMLGVNDAGEAQDITADALDLANHAAKVAVTWERRMREALKG